MNYAIAVPAALGAACCFALAAVIQQGAAERTHERPLNPRLLLALARNPRWLAGWALGGLSFAVQGVALAFGPLTLVLPLTATDVVFALPMIAVVHHYRLTRKDWAGACAVGGGVALFLAVSPPAGGAPAPGFASWAPALVVAAVLVAAPVSVATRVRGRDQVMLLAAAAGVVFGVLDALTKSTVDLLASRGAGTLVHWEFYGWLAAGLAGMLLSQSAYRAGPLSLSLPAIDTLEPVCAVALGAAVFGERLAPSLWQLVLQLAGGAAAVTGIAVLSRSSIAVAEARARPESSRDKEESGPPGR